MSVGVAALEDKIPAERLPNHSGRLAWAEYSSRTLLSEEPRHSCTFRQDL